MELNIEDIKSLEGFMLDDNEDGALDNIVGYKRDSSGRIVELSIDFDGDNMADSKIFIEYDNAGRIYKVYRDKNHDGTIDSVVIYEYGADETRTVQYDDNADGKIDYIEKIDESGLTTITDVRDFKQKFKEAFKEIFFK